MTKNAELFTLLSRGYDVSFKVTDGGSVICYVDRGREITATYRLGKIADNRSTLQRRLTIKLARLIKRIEEN